jgi:hypothetical protein
LDNAVDTTDDMGSFTEKFLDNITTSSFDVGNGGGETSGNYHLMNWDGTVGEYGGSLEKYVAYCWSAVAGYSSFGKFTGNASTNGQFIHTGMRSAWVLIKNITSGSHWRIWDTSRDPYNLSGTVLNPSGSNDESTSDGSLDIYSDGFRMRSSYANSSGDTYIYAAFAESPTKYSIAR